MNIHQKRIYKVAKLSHVMVLKNQKVNMNFKRHYKRTKAEYANFSLDHLNTSIKFFKGCIDG